MLKLHRRLACCRAWLDVGNYGDGRLVFKMYGMIEGKEEEA
jgi:hypothetical protein